MLARLRPRLFGAILHPLRVPRPLARALSERVQPRPWTSERRKGRGGEWCTEAIFRMRYRDSPAWDGAEVERRRDSDGALYTLAEFRDFYAGDIDGGGAAEAAEAAEAEADVAERWAAAKYWDQHMTSLIKRETSTSRLLDVHAEHAEHDAWNAVHLNALWHRLGALDRGRAGLHRRDGELERLRAHTAAMLPVMDGRALSSIAHSLARARLCGRPPWLALWELIAAEAQGRLCDFDALSLSSLALALATARHEAPALLDVLAGEAAGRASTFGPQGLANTAWAFAKLQHDAPALFDTIGDAAISRLDDFEDQGLSTTAWAFATAGHHNRRFFEAVGEHINARGRIDSFRPQHLANLAWAFAMADVRCDALFQGPEFADACRWMEARLIGDNRSLVQLNRWQLWRDECCEAGHSWPALPGPLRAACAEQAKWFGAHKAKLDVATPRAISTSSRGAISTPPPGDRSSKT